MGKLIASVATGNYDRMRPLLDGVVNIDGVDPVFMRLEPEEIFFRAFRQCEFDICELSLSSSALKTAMGDCSYVGVPVFLSRAFRHTSIYVRADSGLTGPLDLVGKRMGTAEYQVTANVWARGMLEHQYGLKPSQMTWVRGGLESPGRREKIEFALPEDVKVEQAPSGKTLNQMLLSGEIDAFMGPRAPSSFAAGDGSVRWLFSDPRGEALKYFHQFNVFPIMHIVGVRKSLVEAHPWIPVSVLKAFSHARDLALRELENTAAPKVMLPFVEDNLSDARRLIGTNFWSYGLEENRKVLDQFLQYHYEQGLSPKRLKPEELFHKSTWEVTII